MEKFQCIVFDNRFFARILLTRQFEEMMRVKLEN